MSVTAWRAACEACGWSQDSPDPAAGGAAARGHGRDCPEAATTVEPVISCPSWCIEQDTLHGRDEHTGLVRTLDSHGARVEVGAGTDVDLGLVVDLDAGGHVQFSPAQARAMAQALIEAADWCDRTAGDDDGGSR